MKGTLKFTKKQWDIGKVLVEELSNWKSTTEVTTGEFIKLVKKLSKLTSPIK
jgi:hypothetical protein